MTCADHRPALPLPLAGSAIQVDQAASLYQTLSRHLRKCGENADMDRHLGLRLGCHREKTAQNRGFALHNMADSEPDAIRKNTTRSTV